MNVIIARDGKEIGAYREQDLPNLARAGELLPTDHYWYTGMEDWLMLGDLLGPEPWEPEELPPPPPPKSWQEILREPRSRVIAGVCAVCLVALIGVYFVHLSRVRSERAREAQAAAERANAKPRDIQLRDQAAAELRAKIEKLPAAPTPNSNVYYYGFTVAMESTGSPESPWLVTIRGNEDVLDPETRQPAWQTAFTLQTDYRNREWTFKSYHAKTTNMKDGTTQAMDTVEEAGTPPAVAMAIGLKLQGASPQTPPPTIKIAR